MNRRTFLRRAAGAVLGLALSTQLPGIAEAPPMLPSPSEDISIRIVQNFDEADQFVTRFDVLYGVRTLRPEFACRVIG